MNKHITIRVFILLTILVAVLAVTVTKLLQNSIEKNTEASTRLCPISGTYDNGCFTINRCERAGGGNTDQSSCYRYISYTCNSGPYKGQRKILDPMSRCWSKAAALERIQSQLICNCDGLLPPNENPPPVKCNNDLKYAGRRGTYEIDLEVGSDPGYFGIFFDAYSVPDKFRVSYLGYEVINTGFRGDPGFEGDLGEQVTQPPNGYAEFYKDNSEPLARLYVDAPLDGTGWEIRLSCAKSARDKLYACPKACMTPCHSYKTESECTQSTPNSSTCQWCQATQKCYNTAAVPMCKPNTDEIVEYKQIQQCD